MRRGKGMEGGGRGGNWMERAGEVKRGVGMGGAGRVCGYRPLSFNNGL